MALSRTGDNGQLRGVLVSFLKKYQICFIHLQVFLFFVPHMGSELPIRRKKKKKEGSIYELDKSII